MSKSAPEAPDYQAAAQEQAESSREVTEQQTWANRPTLNTPFGQQTWEVTPQWDPATGQYINTWTQNTNLTPESQSALDSQMRLQQGRSGLAESLLGRVQEEYGDTMDWSKFDELAQTPEARSLEGADPYYQKSEDAIYGKFKSRMEPRFARDKDAMRTQLYNSGLKEGDAAYDQAMADLNQQQDDAYQQAEYQAIIGSGADASRRQGMDLGSDNQRFGQQMTAAGFQNTKRQQQIAEEMQRRGFSLNEINAILTGQQVGMPSMPGFNTAQRSEGVQSLQAAQMQGQAALDAFNAEQQATQGMMSGIAGGAMMFSDRRLKKDIQELGVSDNGLRTYKFHYLWESETAPLHIGYMADEVEKLYPDCVIEMHGYKMVNYAEVPLWQ